MSINWDVPLKNGKNVFFTEDSFNVFDNFITFEERFLKRLEDHDAVTTNKGVESLVSNASKVPEIKQESATLVPGNKEAVGKQASDRKNKFTRKEDGAQSSVKLALNITKGRLPPPRKSSLCHEDQKLYLSLYSKYGGHSPADPTEEEITELNKLKVLQAVVSKEQEDYHNYSLSLAKALQAEYQYMETSARKYMEARLSSQRREVEMYPSHYNVVSSFTLKGTGQVSQLTYIKPLLQLGSVPKMILPIATYDRRQQLTIDTAAVSQENPVQPGKGKEANCKHKACSRDENAEILAVQHRAHIVISPGALMCLTDNQTPDYNRGWELPFSVKEYDVIEGDKKVRHRIVYIDKPFTSTNVTERAMNTKFYKFLLRNIFSRHSSKDHSMDNNSSVDKASKRTEDKKSMGEGIKSTNNQGPQLGDIFDIGTDSVEDMETFGTSSFTSFKTKRKSETSNTEGSKKLGTSGTSSTMEKMGKSDHVSRNVEQDSFNIFSDETVEDIETFGLNISREKSSTQTSGLKMKNKEMGQIEKSNIVTETTATTQLLTDTSDTTQIPPSPVQQSLSTSVTMVTESTSASGSESKKFNVDTSNSSVDRETDYIDKGKQDSMETPSDSTVTVEIHKKSDGTSDTPTESNVTMETLTESGNDMKAPTESPVAKATPTESNVTIETARESQVAMETPIESNVTIETFRESEVAMETPTEGNVSLKRHTENDVAMETENNAPIQTGAGDKGQKVKDMPYILIPIDIPGGTAVGEQVNVVAMDTNSNPEHEIIMDAPSSPVSMDTTSSLQNTDTISSPSERSPAPKIIPLSVEKVAPHSFCSPDTKKCVMIPLDGEDNINETVIMDHSQGNNQTFVMDHTQQNDQASDSKETPPLSRQRQVQRSATPPVVSDLDSDDDGKLLIDVSPLKDIESEQPNVRSKRRGQVKKPKSQLNDSNGGKTLERMGLFYESNNKKDGRLSTRVTRSRLSLDALMAQMKSSSDVEPQSKKGDKIYKQLDRNESISESGNVIGRCTRSRSLSLTNRSSPEVKLVEVKSEFISCDQTFQTRSRVKKSVTESDSDSCYSMEGSDVKDQGSKVTRRSSRLSTSSSCSEVKGTDRNINASSKVKASDVTSTMECDIKIENTEIQPVVVRKRGRPRKIPPMPPSGTSHQQQSRSGQNPAENDAASVEEEGITSPTPVKKKRGRPPKPKVEAVDKPVETELTKTDDNSMVNRSKIEQTGSKVNAIPDKSVEKTPTVESHVSRVKPKLVATLTRKTGDTVAKPLKKEQRAGTKRASSEVSTFDSILQGMQNMLHTPDQKVTGQKVKGNQCSDPSEVSNSAPVKQPDGQSNVSYHLWSLGGFQVVVRCGYHGTIRDDLQKLSKIHLCTKMEYQSSEGLEQVTPSETCRSWISGYIRPHCKLLRARIDPLKSELVALEEIGLSQLIGSQQTFKPGDAFLMLQNIFHKLHLQPPGQYLLHHGVRDRNCNIKKSTDMKKRGSYDLHFQHFGFMTTNTPDKGIPWLPIDPAIILPSHMTRGRIPATFEPTDYKAWIPSKKNKGKRKKRQTKR